MANILVKNGVVCVDGKEISDFKFFSASMSPDSPATVSIEFSVDELLLEQVDALPEEKTGPYGSDDETAVI